MRLGIPRPACELVGCLWAWAALSASAANEAAPDKPLRMDIEWVSHSHRPSPRLHPSGTDSVANEPESGPFDQWSLSPADRRLSIVLQRWSAQAGWQLVWEAERDFPVGIQTVLKGTLAEALQTVMRSVAYSDYPLQVVMNPNDRVIRVRHLSGSSP